MIDKDIEHAVRFYQREKKNGGCTWEEFMQEIRSNSVSYTPLSAAPSILWKALNMEISDLVKESGKDMAKFARRFCIPYRTLQAWCDGSNECPIYIKLMICEIMGYLRLVRTIQFYPQEMLF